MKRRLVFIFDTSSPLLISLPDENIEYIWCCVRRILHIAAAAAPPIGESYDALGLCMQMTVVVCYTRTVLYAQLGKSFVPLASERIGTYLL